MDIKDLGLSADLIEAVKLIGNQKKIDKNGNGKLDADDFKKLRKEETEEMDETFYNKNTSAYTPAQYYIAKHPEGKGPVGGRGTPLETTTHGGRKQAALDAAKASGGKAYYVGGGKQTEIKEETEQLDELSKKTLGSYVKKASADASSSAFNAGGNAANAHTAKLHGMAGGEKELNKASVNISKVSKRTSGINKAVSKLTKEELTLEDYDLEDLEDFMMSEDFEQLDELSKKTLGSYVIAAGKDKEYRTKHHADLRKADDDLGNASSAASSHHITNRKTRDDAQNAISAARSEVSKAMDKNGDKKYQRSKGIQKALNKLTKEELTLEDYDLEDLEDFMMSEEFDQLDEISGKVLGSYIQKARADANAKYTHGRELDNHPKVAKISDKIRDYYDRREYTKSGESKHRKAINKAHDEREVAKKKLDPEYPKSVNGNKRLRGIEKAASKLTHGKLTNEQMEEIEALAAKHGLGE